MLVSFDDVQGPSCDISANEKTVRRCIPSGNVGVYLWIRYRSLVMEYGETCIPGRMYNLHPILTVADLKFWCDESHGYPNWDFGLWTGLFGKRKSSWEKNFGGKENYFAKKFFKLAKKVISIKYGTYIYRSIKLI